MTDCRTRMYNDEISHNIIFESNVSVWLYPRIVVTCFVIIFRSPYTHVSI